MGSIGVQESFDFLVRLWTKEKRSLDPEKLNMPTNEDVVIGARIRPLLEHESKLGQFVGTQPRDEHDGVVDVHELGSGIPGGPKLKSSEFYVDKVYGPDCNTKALYDDLVKPLTQLALEGGVGTVFAYGQTGSGKTFTVSQLEELVAREIISPKSNKNVHVSIIELGATLNSAYDLLNNRKSISILEDSFGQTQLVGATEPRIYEPEHLIELIAKGAKFRRTAPTSKNDFSSRSHAICKITITDHLTPGAPDGILCLVDLAGSEVTADYVGHNPELMRETCDINKSLSILKDCIRDRAQAGNALEGTKTPYVPFRYSVLTKTLKHVFDPMAGRNSKTAVIACINPSYSDAGASRNTLRYAEMLRIPVPKAPELVYDAMIPKTWSNEQTKAWITANSGKPSMKPEILAPYHNGQQLISMPKAEFLSRCKATEGVTEEQALAFYHKLWRLHVSKRTGETNSSAVSSELRNVPFKNRLVPGTVVRLMSGDLMMILSVVADNSRVYVSARIAPGEYQNAFALHIWQQTQINMDEMQEEIILEYDEASRYYYLSV